MSERIFLFNRRVLLHSKTLSLFTYASSLLFLMCWTLLCRITFKSEICSLHTCIRINITVCAFPDRRTTCNFDFICCSLFQPSHGKYSSTCVHNTIGKAVTWIVYSIAHIVSKKNSMSIFARYCTPYNIQSVDTSIAHVQPWNTIGNLEKREYNLVTAVNLWLLEN